MRTLFHMLPVREGTRDRVRKLKEAESYDTYIVQLLDKYEFTNIAAEHRYSLRGGK